MYRFWTIFFLFLSSCTTIPSVEDRRSLADQLATKKGWQRVTLKTGEFDLVAYLPLITKQADKLTVYIEGDGFAWSNKSQASSDPTPLDPIALKLGLTHQEGNAAYLARPCQFIDAESSGCSRRYWTNMRFAPEVVSATRQAIDALKLRFGASRLTLVGYSGGGAVAVLVAARSVDVERLVTVAGNLDHRAWTSYQRITPLDGSLSPSDHIDTLRHLPQWHFVGAHDANITPAMIQGFADRFSPAQRPAVIVKPGFDHRCCWVENWPEIWRESVSNQ